MPIKHLVSQAKADNQKAFTQLYKRYYPVIEIFVKKQVQTQASDDIVQETFIRAFLKIHYFDDSLGQFVTWLHTIAHNLIVTYWRTEYRRQVRTLSISTDYFDNVGFDGDGHRKFFGVLLPQLNKSGSLDGNAFIIDKSTDIFEIEIELKRALNLIPKKKRRVFEMRYYGGLSYEEIAEQEGLPLGTVKSRITRVRMMLRTHMYELFE